MDDVTIIRIIAGLLFIVVFFGVGTLYILTLSRALNKCSPLSRTIHPGTLWLLLIPLVDRIWDFFVVVGLAKTLGNEFRARNIQNVGPKPGIVIGIALCICGIFSIKPIIRDFAEPLYLVLWIIYWVKIAGYSRLLDQAPAMGVVQTDISAI